MPETPEVHKEIIEIKREVREIRQAQDAIFHQDRKKWEDHLFKVVQNNSDALRVLLAIDGTKSAKDLEKECGLKRMKCWRILHKLENGGIISKLEETKKGSLIYIKRRWYMVLRLDDQVSKKLSSGSLQS